MASCRKISVITPAYNVASYIGQCIESVQAQTFSDWEMLIVDDASTDDTVAAVQRYLSDPRIRLLQNPQNMGPSDTRNRALDAAQGEWIAVVDADDWIAPERFEKLLHFAESHGAEMVADLQVYQTAWGSIYQVSWATYAKPPRTPRTYCIEEVIKAHPSFKPLLKRAFLNEQRIRYQSGIRVSEDYAFFIEVLLKGGRFALLPEPMYYYRVRPGTTVTRYDTLEERRKSLEYLLQLPQTTPRIANLLRWAYRRERTYALYPQLARCVKQGEWRTAANLLRESPQLIGLLLIALPQALYRRLFDRDKLIDPWRETKHKEAHR
ncbi:MAG: glycosyltransferase family 2 protein [Fimbriimonadales bacterium]